MWRNRWLDGSILCEQAVAWQDWWKLCRGGNASVGLAAVLVTTYASVGFNAGISVWGVFLTGLGVSLFMSGGNALNDLIDLDSDAHNHPHRPLVVGAITTDEAKTGVWILFLSSFLVTLGGLKVQGNHVGQGAWLAMATYAIAIFGQFSYELGPSYKRRGFQGNVVIALLLGLVMIHAVTAVGATGHPRAWFMAGVAMLANLAREVLKDCEDLSGDTSRQTLPTHIGLPSSRIVAYFLIMGSIVLTLVSFGTNVFPQWSLFVMLPSLFLLFSTKPLLAHEKDRQAQRRLRIAIIFGLLGFLVAALLETT